MVRRRFLETMGGAAWAARGAPAPLRKAMRSGALGEVVLCRVTAESRWAAAALARFVGGGVPLAFERRAGAPEVRVYGSDATLVADGRGYRIYPAVEYSSRTEVRE
jgi:hypothetical protein